MTLTSDVARREPSPTVPSRYRSDEKRSARLGKVLRLFAGVRELDEELMQRLAEGFMQKDELGAELARAMRLPAGHPERVTMAQFQTASADGIAAVADPPPALRAFFDVVDSVPDWVDWDLVEEGGRVVRSLGQNAADVLMQLSLLGGYRFGGPHRPARRDRRTRRRHDATATGGDAEVDGGGRPAAQHASRRRGIPADPARARHARPRQRDLHPALGRRPMGRADQPERPGRDAGAVQRRAGAGVARLGCPDHSGGVTGRDAPVEVHRLAHGRRRRLAGGYREGAAPAQLPHPDRAGRHQRGRPATGAVHRRGHRTTCTSTGSPASDDGRHASGC